MVVVWRPIKQKEQAFYPPKFISEYADMFDIDGFEQPPKEKPEALLGNLEIRNFERVPMSNLPAVLPKTKLIFRPADAFLFDTISFITLAVILSSIRLNSRKLDFLALISVCLWTFRTILRYSNKLARYDLLVKKFLTSKISHRNAGALKYLTSEAGSQRAVRVALIQSCIFHLLKRVKSPFQGKVATENPLTRAFLTDSCPIEVNKILRTDKEVQIDVERALKDLEDLQLVQFSNDGEALLEVKDSFESTESVKKCWIDLLESKDLGKFVDDVTDEEAVGFGLSVDISGIAKAQNSSILVPEGSRRSFAAAINATAQNAYTNAKPLLKDQKGLRNLKASLEFQERDSTKAGRSNGNKKKWYF